MSVIDDKAKHLIDSYVKGKDFFQVTPKEVRLHVETALSKHYDKKEFVKVTIERAMLLNEKEKKKSATPSTSKVTGKKIKKPTQFFYSKSKINKLSPGLAEICGYRYLTWALVMKQVWAYIADKNLKVGKLTSPDALLTRVFNQTEPFNTLSVLSQNAKSLMEEVNREDIPAEDMDKLTKFMEILDAEKKIEFAKKMEKYEQAIKKQENSIESPQGCMTIESSDDE